MSASVGQSRSKIRGRAGGPTLLRVFEVLKERVLFPGDALLDILCNESSVTGFRMMELADRRTASV